MRRFALRRLLLGLVTVLGVSVIIFVATRLSGDVTLLLASPDASQEQIEQLRRELGLDRSLPMQYAIFLKNVGKGDFGRSTRYHRPAIQLVTERLPATVQLAAAAFAVSVVLGLTIGVLAAVRRGSWADVGGRGFAMLGQAMPEFWIGTMAILIFSVQLGWLPTSGRGGLAHLVMPALTLGWFSAASITRITRSAMLEVLDSDYIKTARLKGVPERVVIWKHALRNALIPVVAMGGLQLGRLLGGAVIVETVFSWPGLGQLILDGAYTRDYAVVQAGVFVTSLLFIGLNFLVDLTYGLIDPRVKV